MSQSSRTRRSCGVSGSTAAASTAAASTIPIISALASGIPIRGSAVPAGTYPNDHVVALRLQVTPREASVFVDGYAAGDRRRLRRCLPASAAHSRSARNRHLSSRTPHAPAERLLQPGIHTHDPPHARSAAARGNAGAAAGAASAAGVSTSARTARDAAGASAEPRDGALALRVQPGDATVLVDGEPWQGPQSAGPARRFSSAKGRTACASRSPASSRSRSTSTSAPVRRPASTSACCRSEAFT